MCELIFYNARAITMNPAQPLAQLVAIRGKKIFAVGDNSALSGFPKRGSRVIDCGGKTLLPGFIDAHCHIYAYGENILSLSLSPRDGVLSIADIQRLIHNHSRTKRSGTWIRAKGYDEFYLAEKRHPNRWDLDRAAPAHPVKLSHRSGHAHVLNSLALKYVGISAETGDPPGGVIDRDPATGEPTGILYGMSEYLSKRVPSLDDTDLKQSIALVNRRLLSYGITSVQDASSANNRDRWQRFLSWKTQKVFLPRVTMMMGYRHFLEMIRERRELDSADSEVCITGVKIVAGQVTGSLNPGPEELTRMIAVIQQAGLQAAVHGVEVPVIEAVCDAVECLMKMCARPDPRHRIEHCSLCPPPLLKRMAKLGIYVVTQPSFIHFNGERYVKTIPAEELENIYPIGSMLRAGVRIGFSSDFPIVDPNPLVGIQAAILRRAENGVPIQPHEGIGLLDAIRLYTLGAAGAAHQESTQGSVSPGKFADLVLLNEDISRIAPEHIKDVRVQMTVLDGQIVHEEQV